MRISVIICTFDRCQLLRDVLEGVAKSQVPEEIDWEVVVIDNNSSDETAEIVQGFTIRYPGRFRYVLEPRQGKSFALNTGIRETQGDVLAFVDDDVSVEPTWLWSLCRSLQEGEWGGVGGRTLLGDSSTPPPWLALSGPYSLAGVLGAAFDLGDGLCEMHRAPYGANMAYRREMFIRHGVFRTDLGPSANRSVPRPNEDTEFGRRIIAAGERLIYAPAAIVHHPVSQSRIKKEYFLSWWYDYGRATVRETGRRPDILGIQRRYWSVANIAVKCLLPSVTRWVFSVEPARRFFHKCWVWMILGQIREIYREWGPSDAEHGGSKRGIEPISRVES